MRYSAYYKTLFKRVDVVSQTGAVSVGCKAVNRSIFPSLSARKISDKVFSEIGLAVYSPSGDCFVVCSEGKVYVSADGLIYSQFMSFPAERPFWFHENINGEWITCVAADGRCLLCGADGLRVENTALNLSCGVKRCGRLFGADSSDKFKLRWSGEGGAFDWKEGISGAGWLSLAPDLGKILSVVNLGPELVAVRKYGLTVLKVYGNPENFSVAPVNFATSEISPSSVAVTGGTLIFYCSDGLFRFDGNSLLKLNFGFVQGTSDVFCAVAAGGDYYACISGGVLFAGADGSSFIINCAAHALAVRGREVFAFCGDGIYKLQNGGEYRFTSGEIDFGISGEKALNYIIVDGLALTVEVYNGKNTRVFKSVKGRFPVHMRGENFKITLTGAKKINSVTACAEVPCEI